jgi:hypothetical protein
MFRSIKRRRVMRQVANLVAHQRHLDAISLLMNENRRNSCFEFEKALIGLRYDAFFAIKHSPSATPWPPSANDLFATSAGIPEVTPEQLNADTVRSAVIHRGSLIVRGLLNENETSLLRDSIDYAYADHDKALSGSIETSRWFTPIAPTPHPGVNTTIKRDWFRDSGAELAADSPRGLFNIISCFQDHKIIDLVAEYLEERPALSVRKTSLRRVRHDQTETGWHQDGSFLGQGIRSLNVWVALTDCGVDAPTMDMVPKRLHEIAPTGTHGAAFDWSVSREIVDEYSADLPPVRLQFKAGDAILFDEMNLHCTAIAPGMTKDRYAIEAWFFAPSCYPMNQLPLMV